MLIRSYSHLLILTSPALLALTGCPAATPATPAPTAAPIVIVVTATPAPTAVPVDTPVPVVEETPAPTATPFIVIGRDERQKIKDYALAIGQKIDAADTLYRVNAVKSLIEGAKVGSADSCPQSIEGWRWKKVSQEERFQKALDLLGRAASSQSDKLANTSEPLEMPPYYYIQQLDDLMGSYWVLNGH